MQLKNKESIFWLRNTILVFLYFYYIAINLIQPNGWVSYTWHYSIWFVITSYVVFWEGRQYLGIYKQIWLKNVNMNTLVGLAAHILFLYSVVMAAIHLTSPMYFYDQTWEGSAILIIFTNIGVFIQSKISISALEIYNKLNEMRNQEVIVLRNGEKKQVATKEVVIGEVIFITRGMVVPLDGILLEQGTFDYSNITGESKEVIHYKNDVVMSGSYNIGNSVKIQVTKTFKNSTINHIVDKIEEVSSIRPKMQQLADRIMKIFIPGIIVIAIITFVVWLALGLTQNLHLPWIVTNSPLQNAIKASMTTIAIACPCALGLATPLVYTVSSMLAAKHGIIINEPKALEEINNIKIIAFDKTGTLTSSVMEVVKVHGNKKLLGVASGLEAINDHPIAKAIRNYAKSFDIQQIEHISNFGIQGRWQDKKVEIKQYEVGPFPVNKLNTCVALYLEKKVVVVYELVNKIKEGVTESIAWIKKSQIEPVMITGDLPEVANDIAKKIGIKRVYAGVSPLKKSQIIQDLQKEGKTAFVGDGFNDAIAVKQANLSMAFNTGSNITNSLSDISIISNDFRELICFIKLGKMNSRRVKIALFYAFAFNCLAVPLACLFLVQPWMGAAIMAISDILVMLNSLVYKMYGKRKMDYHKREAKWTSTNYLKF